MLDASGALIAADLFSLELTSARPNTPVLLVIGYSALNLPFSGGTLVPSLDFILAGFSTSPAGALTLAGPFAAGVPAGFSFYAQYWIPDPLGVQGFAASNALLLTAP